MYSFEVDSFLKSKKAGVGDRIKIIKGKNVYEGLLMPRIELGDPSSIVIKLDNGYNVGIKHEKGLQLSLVKKGKPLTYKPNEIKALKDSKKPTVSILGCGGTIVSRVEYTTGAVSPAFSPGDLLKNFPELNEIANIDSRKLFDLLSEDIGPSHWQVIAREVEKEVKRKVDGVVLMHGTDTLHYTSAALSFMLQNLPIPVVLVGAQRSSDRGSSDNLVNLVCSTLTAAKSDIAQVVVCMHGNMSDEFCFVHQGTKVRKLHTSRRDAFKSVNVLPFARVWYSEKRIEYLRNDFEKRNEGKFILDDKINPNVGLIHFHPGIKPEFVDGLADYYDGIVIEASGLGHVSTSSIDDKTKPILPSLKNLIDSGIPVVFAPQTIFGRLDLNVYAPGRKIQNIGVIGHELDMTPETALVKLMFVLGHTKEMGKVKEMMYTNIAGEISKRTDPEGFF